MENFNQIFILLSNSKTIGLNTNILETGLINIIALLAILFYTGQDFLGSLLDERKRTIVKSVQNAEDQLIESEKRLKEAQKQLNQVAMIIDEIKNETIITKKKLLEVEAYQTRKELIIRFEKALSSFRSKERQIFFEIKQQIILVVLEQTVKRIQKTFKSKERANSFINETINKLEGDLL